MKKKVPISYCHVVFLCFSCARFGDLRFSKVVFYINDYNSSQSKSESKTLAFCRVTLPHARLKKIKRGRAITHHYHRHRHLPYI